ncbi:MULTISPECIES: ribbon-helix-helix domain-containing protein [Hyphomicrobiales]|uniref:ribbon-helix-helix domain-containing protein n=1 Tax=Hyphomicrobiales TaxID=356 RepID=UPI0025C3E559|nr:MULTISPECIES: ribbon-helix-helix domain-containing protein [Hyphomicrobiales]MBX3559910.1 hypothetical protein [Chelatococcus sp.]MCO5154783.1 hypothetical protein [Shinella sp.]
MARAKPKLSGALDDLAAVAAPVVQAPVPPPAGARTSRAGRPRRNEETSLVGGQLATRYSRSLNMLSAETGKTNRQLLEEALDDLFTKYGARVLSV